MSHHQHDRYQTGITDSDRYRQTSTQSGADRYSTGGMSHHQHDRYQAGIADSDRYRQTGTQSGSDRYSEAVDHTQLDRYRQTGTQSGSDRYPTGNGPVLPRCRTGTALAEMSVTGTPSN